MKAGLSFSTVYAAENEGRRILSDNVNNNNNAIGAIDKISPASCKSDRDCVKQCPPKCRIVNCIGGLCFCEC